MDIPRTSLSMSYHMEKASCFQGEIVVNFKLYARVFRQCGFLYGGARGGWGMPEACHGPPKYLDSRRYYKLRQDSARHDGGRK